MFEQAKEHYAKILGEIRGAGLWKEERVIASPQGVEIEVNGRRVLNFCANNYLGLANHPVVVAAARRFFIPRASMPMADCLRRCWGSRMRLFPMH